MCKNPSPSYKASPDTWCRWTHPKLTPWSQIYLPKRMENKHTCVIGYNWDSAPIHSQPGQSNQTTSSNNTNKTTTRHKTVIMKSLLLETWLIIIIIFFLPSVPRSRGSLKINYAIQRWVRSSVRAVSGRQTVVQQNSIETLHQNRNPLK